MCLLAPLCAHFPLLTVLKQFWNLITLFCTRAVWKFSNPMDFSWGNANLFKPELVVKIQLQPSLSALQTWERAPTETPPTQAVPSQAAWVQAWGQGDPTPSPGTVLPRSDPQLGHGAIWGAGSNISASSAFASPPAPSSRHSSYQTGALGRLYASRIYS